MITQVCQKQGAASPDIVMLKRLHVTIIQEPSKYDQINDSAMKELVSGVEPTRGRPMWGVPIQFVPQFKLYVCSDHGTWRRIAVAPSMSTFADNPEIHLEIQIGRISFKKIRVLMINLTNGVKF